MLASDTGLIAFWERIICPMQNYVKHYAILYKAAAQIPVAKIICWYNLIHDYEEPHNSLVRAKSPRQLWVRQHLTLA